MSGEIYDLDALKRGLITIRDNLAAIEEALTAERAKAEEYERLIIGAEAILEAHKKAYQNDRKD